MSGLPKLRIEGAQWDVVGPVRLARPSGWSRVVEPSEDGLSVSYESPGVTFGCVNVYSHDYDPADLVAETSRSLRSEHPGLETEKVEDPAWPQATTVEGIFISLDMVSYCWIRSFRLGAWTVLVLVQSIEPEHAVGDELFEMLSNTLELDEAGQDPSRPGAADFHSPF